MWLSNGISFPELQSFVTSVFDPFWFAQSIFRSLGCVLLYICWRDQLGRHRAFALMIHCEWVRSFSRSRVASSKLGVSDEGWLSYTGSFRVSLSWNGLPVGVEKTRGGWGNLMLSIAIFACSWFPFLGDCVDIVLFDASVGHRTPHTIVSIDWSLFDTIVLSRLLCFKVEI